ncbi:MAG: Ni/Fe hydrogenase [Proteobacteria bacterium CG1_02_64_396]|nr:MAG: Ni/Fe hydrogenase [Proteobacteria bacterium CG1_02_64_396]
MRQAGFSRRDFLKFCTVTAAMMGLSPALYGKVAQALETRRRPSLIWLPFQECTGCTESLTRTNSPAIGDLVLDHISLDYSETLQAASGHQAEQARAAAMKENWGQYILAIDGSVSTADGGIHTVLAGRTALDILKEAAEGAAAVVAIGSCASFGGLPAASPNPTNAKAISELIGKPVINVPGCPPIGDVITGVVTYVLTFGKLPELDDLNRPTAFYGQRIHDRCYRRPFYDKGLFARGFDDAGAKAGHCLFQMGCKGPVTYNACATMKWNQGTSWPVQSGHGCLGCSEPNFWDNGSFYAALSTGTDSTFKGIGIAAAAAAGVAAGAAMAFQARAARNKAQKGE